MLLDSLLQIGLFLLQGLDPLLQRKGWRPLKVAQENEDPKNQYGKKDPQNSDDYPVD